MKRIDEQRLENDLAYRFEYVSGFIGITAEDIEIIHASAEFLAPKVEGLVAAVYAKLRENDATWRHFLPRQDGYEGEIPSTLEELDMEHPQIKFRMQHLSRYLVRLVTKPYDGKMVQYLDTVGKIHTDKAGSPEIQVPLVQMNALMGFVSAAVHGTILDSELDDEVKHKAVKAFDKLLWIQNDLITRHYQG